MDYLPKEATSPEALIPSQGFAFCNKLFETEKLLHDFSGEARKERRLKQEEPS